MARYVFTLLFVLAMDGSPLDAQSTPKKIVLIAGKPPHPVGMHEFNAGVQLLAKCLASTPNVQTEFALNGWPRDERVSDNASDVIFYMDGGGRHEVVQEHRRRLKLVDSWVLKGVGFMHYGVEAVATQAGNEFQKWIGGHYEHMYSCNPIWEQNS